MPERLPSSGSDWAPAYSTSGVDAACIWRVVTCQRKEVSLQILLVLSAALVIDERHVEEVVDVANDLLDAAGYKSLRSKS